MMPLLPETMVESNPKFASLWRHIESQLLDEDGGTKERDQVRRERREVEEALKDERIRIGLERLVVEALEGIVGRGEIRGESLKQTLLLISLLKNPTPLSAHELHLLQPDLDSFSSLIPYLTPHLDRYIQSTYSTLFTLATTLPPDTPSQPKPHPEGPGESLPSLLSTHQHTLSTLHSSTRSTLHSLTTSSQFLLRLHTDILHSIIVSLERHKHGSLARHSRSRADHISTVARGLQYKTSILTQEALLRIYTPEVLEALGAYVGFLRQEGELLESRESELQEDLDRRDTTKGLSEVARAIGEVKEEIRRVREDVERFQSSD